MNVRAISTSAPAASVGNAGRMSHEQFALGAYAPRDDSSVPSLSTPASAVSTYGLPPGCASQRAPARCTGGGGGSVEAVATDGPAVGAGVSDVRASVVYCADQPSRSTCARRRARAARGRHAMRALRRVWTAGGGREGRMGGG